jgi:hypothetical protein
MAQTVNVTGLPWGALPYTLPSGEGPDFAFNFAVNAVLPPSFQNSILIEITTLYDGGVGFRQVYSVGDDGVLVWTELTGGVPTVVEVLPKSFASGFSSLLLYSGDSLWGRGTVTKLGPPVAVPFWTNSRGQREVL